MLHLYLYRGIFYLLRNIISCTSIKCGFLDFIWRKLLQNHTDYFEMLIVNMLHHNMHVNDGFRFSNVGTSTTVYKNKKRGKPPKKYEDVHCWTKMICLQLNLCSLFMNDLDVICQYNKRFLLRYLYMVQFKWRSILSCATKVACSVST